MFFKCGVPLQILAWSDNWIISEMKIPQNRDTTLFFIYQLSRGSSRNWPQRGRETWNEKNFSRVLDGATRMALMRALKWAPTWYVSADFPTFISYPDLIQRLAIKGIWDVSPDLSSGGSFQSSQWACSHGTLQNPWEVFSISTLSAALWYLSTNCYGDFLQSCVPGWTGSFFLRLIWVLPSSLPWLSKGF